MTPRVAALAAALVVHVVLVTGVLLQPLGVGNRPLEERFLTAGLFHDSVRMNGPGIDFFALYHAGFNARTGPSIYRALEISTGRTPYFFDYRYLPIAAMTLGRVLSLLPPLAAYRLWLLLIEAMLWLVLLTVFRPLLRSRPGVVGWIALVVSAPYILELHMGQFTFAAASVLALGVWVLERSDAARVPWRGRTAAVAAIAAASLLKVFPAVSLVPCLRRRRWWGVAAATTLLIGALTVPLFWARPDDWSNFLEANALAEPGAGNFGFQYALFLTIQLFGVPWSGVLWSAMILAGLVVFVGAALLVVLRCRRQSYQAEVSVLLLAQALASYQIWEHHMTGVMLAGAMLLAAMLASPAGGANEAADGSHSRLTWVVVIALILIALPTPYVLFDPNPKLWTSAQRMAIQWAKPIPTLILYVCGLVWLLGDGMAVARRVGCGREMVQ
ncbi:MAG: glycosyltransferase family 87 protein [Acidobacteriota bacterium]